MKQMHSHLLEAIIFAAKAHQGQKRKYTGEDYIVHPLEVARMVAQANCDLEIVISAVLHDTVEDCGVSLREIELRFGKRVAQTVEMLTDVSKPEDGNRAVRKTIDREHTAKASKDAMVVKICDLIDNTKSIVEHDKDFAKIYLKEKLLLLEVLKGADDYLWNIAFNQVKVEV